MGAIAVLAIVLDTYVSQLVIGRFLVVELGVVQEHKLEQGLITSDSPQLDTRLGFSPAKRAIILQDIRDCDQPWGAAAVLKEVETQCSYWPASILAQGRMVLVVIPSITMAFLILDVVNGDYNDTDVTGRAYWPCILLMSYACSCEILSRICMYCCLHSRIGYGGSGAFSGFYQFTTGTGKSKLGGAADSSSSSSSGSDAVGIGIDLTDMSTKGRTTTAATAAATQLAVSKNNLSRLERGDCNDAQPLRSGVDVEVDVYDSGGMAASPMHVPVPRL
jgi:hypothetical protein